MTGELPEGVGVPDVRSHAVNISIAGTLVNLTGKYLTADDGSSEEAEAETELNDFIERVVEFGPEVAGGVLLIFASLVTQTGDEATVQRWFDEQGQHIAAALLQEESGD
ncbi:hypothetical protein QDA11_gp52 [Microbacterium phage Jayden]|uniref:Uncharacterized protein n=1 Tax=Microbacterium phage Jayden TaxID=2656550 RepID=A0A649VTL7_9CAUD|nr:hypothetical protein QDA11_gp52 [Microbacterium phage Jayden]QGJ95272.1 hypothetical protein PBI_JAYDEN_52 [Microbacterium phage Jayden]